MHNPVALRFYVGLKVLIQFRMDDIFFFFILLVPIVRSHFTIYHTK